MSITPRPNMIESDEGFSVEVLGLTGLLYREHGKSLRVDSELLAGSAGIVVYRDSIDEWVERASGPRLDQAVSERILENIRRAFRHRGFEIEVL